MNKDYIKQGDCLELMKEIPDKSIDLILCDLPYGTTRNRWDTIIPFDLLWKQYNRIIKDRGAIVLFSQAPFSLKLGASNLDLFKYEWIWRKDRATGFLNANKMPLKNHENILVFYKQLPTYNPQMTYGTPYKCISGRASKNYGKQINVTTDNKGTRYPLTVLEFKKESKSIHPTQKPVDISEYLIKTYTNKGDVVLDNCMGSGTTCVACIKTERHYIGFELDEKYFNIAKDRIEKERNEYEYCK